MKAATVELYDHPDVHGWVAWVDTVTHRVFVGMDGKLVAFENRSQGADWRTKPRIGGDDWKDGREITSDELHAMMFKGSVLFGEIAAFFREEDPGKEEKPE